MHKKILIDDLAVGMFVEDVFSNQGVLLLSANSGISSIDQIEALRRNGVASLFINIAKGIDVTGRGRESGVVIDAARRESDYYKELGLAREIHANTIRTAREALEAVRRGGSFSILKVERAAEEIVDSLLRNSDALVSLCQIKGHDEYTYTHSVHVSILSIALALSLGYSRERLVEVGVGGMLHDIGKMRIPEGILNKPGKYVEWEFTIMKRHPEYGLDIIKDKRGVSDVSKAIIIQHHERVNGKGYPMGLKGEQIAQIGLVSTVADVYDALTSNRIYRSAWTPQKALATIYQGCDEEFSREIVERFARQMGVYPVGSFVRLVSGEMGIVTKIDRGNLLSPLVLIIFDASGNRLERPMEYDLSKKQKEKDGASYCVEISLDPRPYRVWVEDYIVE